MESGRDKSSLLNTENLAWKRRPPGGSCWVPVFPWQQSAPYSERRGRRMAFPPSEVTPRGGKKGSLRESELGGKPPRGSGSFPTHCCQRVGGGQETSARHHSCHGIGWSQQGHSFRFIGNHSWRKSTFQEGRRADVDKH